MKKFLLSLVIMICMSIPALAQDQSREPIRKWVESSICKWVLADDQRVFIFNLGIAYNLGMRDGFDRILRQRDDRIKVYPIFQMYAQDKRLEDLHLAYEAGSTQGYLTQAGK